MPIRLTKAGGGIHRASLREWVVDEEGGLGRHLLVFSLTVFSLDSQHRRCEKARAAGSWQPHTKKRSAQWTLRFTLPHSLSELFFILHRAVRTGLSAPWHLPWSS